MSPGRRIIGLAALCGALALSSAPANAAPAPAVTMMVPEPTPPAPTPAESLGSPTPPAAKRSGPDPSQQAQRHFDLGLALYREGDLRGALTEFRQAHKVKPSYQVLYNLGLVSRELYDWAAALRYYREYLQRGGELIPADRRVVIERTLMELGDRLGRLEIDLRGGPAEVVLDEQPLTRPALEQGIPVNPGRHRLRVSFPGRTAQLRVVEVASGQNIKVTFEPPAGASKGTARAGAPGNDLQVAADSGQPRARSRAHIWTWSATVLLAGGAVASGLMARQSADALSRERMRFPAKPAALTTHQNRTQAYSIAADAMTGTAVILGAISIYLTWMRGDPGDEVAATGHGVIPGAGVTRIGYGWSF